MTGARSPNTADRNNDTAGPTTRERVARSDWLGLLLVLVVFVLLSEARLWRPETVYGIGANFQIAEAQAWWDGHIDLPERRHDTALVDGKVYSHFPVMFTILAAALVPFFHGVPHWFMVALSLSVPTLCYVLFRTLTRSAWWGALTAIGYVCGTSAWPVLHKTIATASPYYVNITLGNIGLLMLLIAFTRRRSIWLGAAGLVVAVLSRQLIVAFALPLVWWAVRDTPPGRRRSQLTALGVLGVVAAGGQLALNALKFGHPLETGYLLIYEGRDDGFAVDARTHGLFSPHFVPRNLYYTNLGLPELHRITVAGEEQWYLRRNLTCTGIWWTTPLLVWLLIDIRRIVAEPAARSLLISAGTVYTALLFFHATGAFQNGYNRFSLDYMPALFAIICPACFTGRRRWISIVMIAWSVAYFRWLGRLTLQLPL
ncbi:MAG: hypothetical protein ACE5HE_03000 [Phycisphaerae bacterium]